MNASARATLYLPAGDTAEPKYYLRNRPYLSTSTLWKKPGNEVVKRLHAKLRHLQSVALEVGKSLTSGSLTVSFSTADGLGQVKGALTAFCHHLGVPSYWSRLDTLPRPLVINTSASTTYSSQTLYYCSDVLLVFSTGYVSGVDHVVNSGRTLTITAKVNP